MGVSKGGIGFPYAFRETAECLLGLYAVVLPILLILVKSIIFFLLHQFDNIAEIAVEHLANLDKDLRVDVLILA